MRSVAAFFVLATSMGPAAATEPALSQKATAHGNNVRQYTAARDIHIRQYGQERLEVVGSKAAITRAYLVPSPGFARKMIRAEDGEFPNQLHEATFLCLEVANISSQPLLVTALKLDVINPGRLGFGPGSFSPGCPTERGSSVNPQCLLQPGEKKKWLAQKGMVIPGVVAFLEGEREQFLFDDYRPRLTTNDEVVSRFNRFLRTNIGAQTTLKVSLFELDYKPVLVAHFRLNEGADMFVREASTRTIGARKVRLHPLQHDAFLGEAISQVKDSENMALARMACHADAAGQ